MTVVVGVQLAGSATFPRTPLHLRFRIAWKRLVSRWRMIPSYCRGCGCDVRDFVAPYWAWSAAARGDEILCYNCFADRCGQLGLDPVWRLRYRRGHTGSTEPKEETNP
jgi:hypothetical protein